MRKQIISIFFFSREGDGGTERRIHVSHIKKYTFGEGKKSERRDRRHLFLAIDIVVLRADKSKQLFACERVDRYLPVCVEKGK